MTFADVLGLWPFTIDEFVQALHDSVSCRIRLDFLYSSRLAILICLNICAYIYIYRLLWGVEIPSQVLIFPFTGFKAAW